MDKEQLVSVEEALALLGAGELESLGRMPWSSNQTFLAQHESGALVIYKPRRGERPLWDFPDGTLAFREVAAFLVSDALGWGIVPPTVLREGPYGEGSVQLFIDHDPDEHYLTLRADHDEVFRRFAAFDFVINNADRKAGHCLKAKSDGHIWGIDHGVCFHMHPKLRTVIWDYAGERVPAEVLSALATLESSLAGQLGEDLGLLLDAGELQCLAQRVQRLRAAKRFPEPRSDYPFPWPMV